MEVAAKEHTVSFGETWYSVALRYKVSVESLMGANSGAAVFTRLQRGQRLSIPYIEYHRRPANGGGKRPYVGTPKYAYWASIPHTSFYSHEHYALPVSPAVSQRAEQVVEEEAAITPPWMATARAEIGTSELWGADRANPRILEYFEASHFWGTDDSGGENAWCASFVAWVMKAHGYTPVRSAFRAREWASFGKTIDEPIYGAIGIKSRTGGGHVAFVVGKNSTGDKLYMLGGNQGNKVQISEYPRSVWSSFVVPTDYDARRGDLPVFNSSASAAGSEQ